MGLRRSSLVGGILLLAWGGHALAQDQEQVTPAEAYDRGTQAYRDQDYAGAAGWYERANQLAPSANALIQAIRAHERANNDLRAATLANELITRYGDRMRRQAGRAITRIPRTAARLDLVCEGCTWVLDGNAETITSFFVTPDTEHVARATFPTGTTEVRATVAPGERREVRAEAPAPEPGPTPDVQQPGPDVQPGDGTSGGPVERRPPRRTRREPRSSGMGVGWFVTALVLTAATGGVAIWSGMDTLAEADEWEMMPTLEGLEAGRELELRTNVLIAAAGGLGAMTLIFALFTDWGGSDDEPADEAAARVSILPQPGGLVLGLGSTLP